MKHWSICFLGLSIVMAPASYAVSPDCETQIKLLAQQVQNLNNAWSKMTTAENLAKNAASEPSPARASDETVAKNIGAQAYRERDSALSFAEMARDNALAICK